MAKRWKIFCLLLALVMVLGAFAGCKKTGEDPTPTPTPLPGDEPIDPTPQIPVDTIDLSEYVIIRPNNGPNSNVSNLFTTAVASFKETLDTLTGSDVLMMSDDYTPADASKKEILLGATNRPESETAKNDLPADKHAFTIRKIGNKLVIVGHTQELITKGMEYLAQSYASKSKGDGKFDIDVDMNYTKTYKYHEVITKKMPNYEVIHSMNANDAVKTSAEKLWNFVNRHTEQEALLGTDYYRPSNGIDELFSRSGIVVGATNHPRTQELMATADYFSWALETNHDQIYLFGTDNDSIEAVCAYMETLFNGSKLESDPTTVRICKSEPVVGSGNDWGSLIPKYNGGTLESVEEFQENYFRLYYTGTTRAAYDEYQAKVLGAGYTLYASNTLEGNVYKTYKNDSMMLHAYYLANKNTVSVATTPLKNFTDYPTAPVSGVKVTEPSMGVVSMDYLKISNIDGAGFIFTMADGSYVIIDGGHPSKGEWRDGTEQEVDEYGDPVLDENGVPVMKKEWVVLYEGTAPKIYNYLKENNQRPDGKILIRAWIITNAKTDHYGAFVDFAKDHAEEVTLEYFVAQFDYEKQIKTSSSEGASGVNAGNGPDVEKIMEAKKLFKNAKHIVPLAGQKMYFGTMETTFLYTAEVFCHENPDNVGDHSLVFRSVLDGTSMLFVSDIGLDVIQILVDNYTSATLKSDFVQAPNHGEAGKRAFWMSTMPKYLLICTTDKEANTATTNNKAFIQYALTLVDDQGKPIIRAVFDGQGAYEIEVAKFPYVYTEKPDNDYGDGEYDTEKDEVTWGDMTENETWAPNEDHRPGDYDENKDSTSWEDMVSP